MSSERGPASAESNAFTPAMKAATSVAASLLQREDIGVLAPGKQADIVAMAGNPIVDIAATEKVDFVMKAGRIYRHQAFDVFQR